MSENTKATIVGLIVGAVVAFLVLWLVIANVSPVRGASSLYGDITPTHQDNVVALVLLLLGLSGVVWSMYRDGSRKR